MFWFWYGDASLRFVTFKWRSGIFIRAWLRSLKRRPIVSACKVLKGCVPVKAQKLPLSENDVATFFRSCKKKKWCLVCVRFGFAACKARSFFFTSGFTFSTTWRAFDVTVVGQFSPTKAVMSVDNRRRFQEVKIFWMPTSPDFELGSECRQQRRGQFLY